MRHLRNIVILTGAGISAESGLRTFRAEDGLWEDHPVEQVATPEGFARDPDLVQRFYDARRAQVLAARPNAAHRALARLDAAWTGELLIVTQNIDDLHERGGSDLGTGSGFGSGHENARVLHMHGEALGAWCTACDTRRRWQTTLADRPACPACGRAALRPDIVWFGEMPYQMERIFAALADADLFVSIGTSGAVYPAAGFVQQAAEHGARTLELNLEQSLGSRLFDETRLGPASVLVPQWVDDVLARETR